MGLNLEFSLHCWMLLAFISSRVCPRILFLLLTFLVFLVANNFFIFIFPPHQSEKINQIPDSDQNY